MKDEINKVLLQEKQNTLDQLRNTNLKELDNPNTMIAFAGVELELLERIADQLDADQAKESINDILSKIKEEARKSMES
jgi:hypothetical protein